MSYVCAHSSVQLDKSRVEKEFTVFRDHGPPKRSCYWTTYAKPTEAMYRPIIRLAQQHCRTSAASNIDAGLTDISY